MKRKRLTVLFALFALLVFSEASGLTSSKKEVKQKPLSQPRSTPALRMEATHSSPTSQPTQGSQEIPTRPIRPHDPTRPEDYISTPPNGFPQ